MFPDKIYSLLYEQGVFGGVPGVVVPGVVVPGVGIAPGVGIGLHDDFDDAFEIFDDRRKRRQVGWDDPSTITSGSEIGGGGPFLAF